MHQAMSALEQDILGLHRNLDVGNLVQIYLTLAEEYQLLRCLLEEKVARSPSMGPFYLAS